MTTIPNFLPINVFHRVIPSGFEPEAYCLEGSCSIQLSYGTDLFLFVCNNGETIIVCDLFQNRLQS